MAMSVESRVRAMTRAERRGYLKAHGWRRLGSNCWLNPTFDDPDGDRGFYTLAAAIRHCLRYREQCPVPSESEGTGHRVHPATGDGTRETKRKR